MTWIFDYLTSLWDLIVSAFNLVISLISALFHHISMLPTFQVVLYNAIGYMPDWLIPFATLSIAISVTLFIIGRNSG